MPQVTSNLIVGKEESITDQYFMLNPYLTPVTSLVGIGSKVSNTLHSWFQDYMFNYRGVSVTDLTVGGTIVTVGIGEGKDFRVDHIIKIDDEFMLVTAVTADVLTVSRAHMGTTATAHSLDAVITIMYMEVEEGAEPIDARYKARKTFNNLTQIFTETVRMSRTAAGISQYGIDNAYEKELQKKLVEVAHQIENAVTNGVKYESGTKRFMAGITTFLTSNVIDGTGTTDISVDLISDLIEPISDNGGLKGNHVLMVSTAQKRKLSTLDINKVYLTHGANSRGETVDQIITDFGTFDIVVNKNLSKGTALFLDSNNITIHPFANGDLTHTYMGKRGDFYEGQIVGEYTLECEYEEAMGKLINLSV